MEKPFYVPFEPGIGSERAWKPKAATVRVVPRVPEAAAVNSPEADAWFASPAIANLNDLRTRKPSSPMTRVAILRDDRHLFVAIECLEPEMSRVGRLVPR